MICAGAPQGNVYTRAIPTINETICVNSVLILLSIQFDDDSRWSWLLPGRLWRPPLHWEPIHPGRYRFLGIRMCRRWLSRRLHPSLLLQRLGCCQRRLNFLLASFDHPPFFLTETVSNETCSGCSQLIKTVSKNRFLILSFLYHDGCAWNNDTNQYKNRCVLNKSILVVNLMWSICYFIQLLIFIAYSVGWKLRTPFALQLKAHFRNCVFCCLVQCDNFRIDYKN